MGRACHATGSPVSGGMASNATIRTYKQRHIGGCGLFTPETTFSSHYH
jgi:hypothetical protein